MARYMVHIGLDKPADYTIKVEGRLKADLSSWFGDHSTYTVEEGPSGEAVTCLTGTVADQAALYGLIGHIRDLGLVLLYVDCLSAHQAGRADGNEEVEES